MTLLAARMVAILAGLGALSLQVAAQVSKPDVCFCLKRKSTGSTEHLGCKHKLAPNAYTPEVACIKLDTGSEYKPQSMEALEEIADGKDGCNPCKPVIEPKEHKDFPRGDEK